MPQPGQPYAENIFFTQMQNAREFGRAFHRYMSVINRIDCWLESCRMHISEHTPQKQDDFGCGMFAIMKSMQLNFAQTRSPMTAYCAPASCLCTPFSVTCPCVKKFKTTTDYSCLSNLFPRFSLMLWSFFSLSAFFYLLSVCNCVCVRNMSSLDSVWSSPHGIATVYQRCASFCIRFRESVFCVVYFFLGRNGPRTA